MPEQFEPPPVPLGAVVRDPVTIYMARRHLVTGHYVAAKDALDVLTVRYPADPRVPYLRYYLQFRTGQSCKAIGALRRAVALEHYDPLADYGEFMSPIQGSARIYAERVRRSVDDLEAAGVLKVPSREELLARPRSPTKDNPDPTKEKPEPAAKEAPQ